MYKKNNVLYMSLTEAKKELERIENAKDEEQKKKERENLRWTYDWDNNSTGAIMNH